MSLLFKYTFAAAAGLLTLGTSLALAADVLVIAQTDQDADAAMITLRHADALTIKPGHTLTGLKAASADAAAELIKTKKPASVVVLRSLPQKDAEGTVAVADAKSLEGLVAAFNESAGFENAKMTLAALPEDDAVVKAAKAAQADVRIVTVARVKNPVSSQARVMRQVVRDTLAAHGAINAKSPEVLLTRAPGKINVGVYDDAGSDRSPGPSAMSKILGGMTDVQFTPVGSAELNAVDLQQFDVLMFPGGSGSGQAKSIGEAGAVKIKSFIENGGGYVGNCAGAYLATTNYKWSLKIVNLQTLDTANKHWMRGSGTVKLELTDDGRQVLGGPAGLIDCYYANGPLLGEAKEANLPGYKVLAYFRSDMAKNGVPGGTMPNTPAVVSADFGKGRVIIFSPHPEYTDGLGYFMEKAVKWASEKPKTAAAN